jgi:lipoprotein-releasing system permease protein
VPWYFYLALKQLFPSGRKFPFFTAISVISVALGVALLILVVSVMDGFGQAIRRMMVETQGDLQVVSDAFINDYSALRDRIAATPGVAGVTPYAQGVAMVEYEGKPAFPMIEGVDLVHVDSVIPIRHYVRYGSLDDLDDDSVILSSRLAVSLGAQVGTKIQLYSPLLLEKLKRDEVLLPRDFRVVGIFEIGHQQLDSSLVIVTLRTMQELYGLGRSVHGFNVKLAAGADEAATIARINAQLPSNVRARSWIETNREFLWVLQLEKNMMLFILLFVVLVAAFLTMSLLLVLVLKKTREIGLLGALGASRRQIAACFCAQAIAIGVAGTGLGLALGFTLLYFRNDAVALLTRMTGSQETFERFYQFSELPAHTNQSDLVIIIVAALALSTLAGLIPATMAARMKPVEALRSE